MWGFKKTRVVIDTIQFYDRCALGNTDKEMLGLVGE